MRGRGSGRCAFGAPSRDGRRLKSPPGRSYLKRRRTVGNGSPALGTADRRGRGVPGGRLHAVQRPAIPDIWIPEVKYRCAAKKSTSSGAIITVEAAIIRFQLVE